MFWLGRLSVKPKVITKTEQVKVKVYDLTQAPHIIEAYANAIDKTMKDTKEIEKAEMEEWVAGYREGYKDGGRR